MHTCMSQTLAHKATHGSFAAGLNASSYICTMTYATCSRVFMDWTLMLLLNSTMYKLHVFTNFASH